LPHTTWGNLALPQRGQRLRAGALSVHAAARWLRVFAFYFFFFGTGMTEPQRTIRTVRRHSAPGTKGKA
jgi:hypothetical protein